MAGYRFVHEIMLPEPTELALHVNNVQFLQFFDEARMAYLASMGLAGYDEDSGLGHMVLSNHCDYKARLNAPDRLLVGVRAEHLGRHSIKLAIRIISSEQQLIAAEGYAVVLCFDFNRNEKLLVSESVRQNIACFECG